MAILAFTIFWGGGETTTTTTTPETGTTATTTPGTGATTTTTPGTGGTDTTRPPEDTENATLRGLIRQEVGEFSLDSVAPFPELIADGALEALTTRYKDAGGTLLVHQLTLWATGDRALAVLESVTQRLRGEGYQVVSDGNWTAGGEVKGRKVVARKDRVEVVVWTNGPALFFVLGPHQIADGFWSELPY